ncbi:MAG: carboxymuconolactone decarboxylase family protein [Planctomycetes bacterium]|nr:carboxymuconolactone decarboxylase family protein [Planctomycetota bacterium]
MTVQDIKDRLPEYAKDLKLNLGAISSASELTPAQAWGSALAAAIAARHPATLRAIATDAAQHLDEAGLRGAKAAAAIMGMNNVYYRFTHFVDDAYASLPARLRMQVIGNPGVERVDFELWCLAASAVNGCGKCMDAHERQASGAGLSQTAVQDVIRIAAIVHGVAQTLAAEDALAEVGVS